MVLITKPKSSGLSTKSNLSTSIIKSLQIRESGKDIIQDRTIYEDAHIFAPNLHAMVLMTNRN